MLRSPSVLQELGGVELCLWIQQSHRLALGLLSCSSKIPCAFQLAIEENTGNSSLWFCSLYYYFVSKMKVYGDQRSPRNEVKVFGGPYLGFLFLTGGTCWPLMCLSPRWSGDIAHHCHSPKVFLSSGKLSSCKEIELGLIALPELLMSSHQSAAAELPFSMWVWAM